MRAVGAKVASPHAARAESAAVYSLGQRPRYRSPVGNARCRRKSSRRRYHCRTARNRGDIRLYNVGISTFPQHNAYGYFYRKQAAPRPSEQAHGARLALLLRLQRDNSLVVVYLGRCPRLYTAALSARVAHSGLRMGFVENVGVVIGSLKVGLFVSRDGHGNGYGHSSRYRNGSQAARAESAAVYSLGQRPRYNPLRGQCAL